MLGIATNIVKSNNIQKAYSAARFTQFSGGIFPSGSNFAVADDDSFSFTSSTGFGISMWVNLGLGTSTTSGLLMKKNEYALWVTNLGQVNFMIVDDSNNNRVLRGTPSNSFPFNQWVHINVEYETNKEVEIYLNNVNVGSLTSDASFDELENTTNGLQVGFSVINTAGEMSTAGFFNAAYASGFITNLHIYSGNLTSNERNNVYNANVDGDFSNNVNNTIVASYLLTSNINDSSGNGFNGSVSAPGFEPTYSTI